MYEVVQLMKDDIWSEKTMCIVMDDAKMIYNPINHSDYISFWEQEENNIKNKITTVSPLSIIGLVGALKKVNAILSNIDTFLIEVADRNISNTHQVVLEIRKRINL